jgi:hypothetical protein
VNTLAHVYLHSPYIKEVRKVSMKQKMWRIGWIATVLMLFATTGCTDAEGNNVNRALGQINALSHFLDPRLFAEA